MAPHCPHIIFDHFIFTDDPRHIRQQEISRSFIQRHGLSGRAESGPGEGIFHIILLEKGLVRPGDVVAGADSHTRSLGAYGALGFGIGSTELGVAWAFGSACFTLGPQVRIRFTDRPGPWVSGKDIALSLIKMGPDLDLRGANLEFEDTGQGRSMADRHTICNMMAEAEAVSAVFLPDGVTFKWFSDRGIHINIKPGHPAQGGPGPDAAYERIATFDLQEFSLAAALPFSPSNVRTVAALRGRNLRVDKAIIGSCTNGQYRDLLAAAGVIHSFRRLPLKTELLIYPGSRKIRERCNHPEPDLDGRTVAQVLEKAGACIRPSWCGLCFGQGKDCLHPGETAITTFNRNWPNRSGVGGRVILVGPAVTAASALAGYECGPDDLKTGK